MAAWSQIPYGLPRPPLQSPKSADFQAFAATCTVQPQNRVGGRPQGKNGSKKVSDRVACFYFLLCMFKGFAFARPLCRWIKVNLNGRDKLVTLDDR
jgi:hypothetical protein